MKYPLIITSAVVAILFSACGDNQERKANAAIVLGDSTTIITEKDSQYLRDDVLDIEPMQQAEPDIKTSPVQKDTVKATSRSTGNEGLLEKGFTVDFGDAKMIMAGLEANDARKQNAKSDASLSYVLKSDDITVGNVVFHGVKNVTLKQRYQTKMILKSAMGLVDLSNLGLYTSGWKTLSGKSDNNKQVFDLNPLKNLSFSTVNNRKIVNAADRELRKRRTSNRTIQSWMKELKRVRNATDKPCQVILDNVQWQVSGTDAKGKPFQKTIRIDV